MWKMSLYFDDSIEPEDFTDFVWIFYNILSFNAWTSMDFPHCSVLSIIYIGHFAISICISLLALYPFISPHTLCSYCHVICLLKITRACSLESPMSSWVPWVYEATVPIASVVGYLWGTRYCYTHRSLTPRGQYNSGNRCLHRMTAFHRRMGSGGSVMI